MRSLQQRIAGSETAKAAGLAVAALAANAVAVVVTVVFTRLLGDEDYGALAALLSTFTILAVAGSSLQVAVARDTALGRLGGAASAAQALRAWTRTLLLVLVGVVIASALMREGIASLVGVSEQPWAAACVPPTGILWLLLSLQRGVLQGLGAYAPVGWSVVSEAVVRLVALGRVGGERPDKTALQLLGLPPLRVARIDHEKWEIGARCLRRSATGVHELAVWAVGI